MTPPLDQFAGQLMGEATLRSPWQKSGAPKKHPSGAKAHVCFVAFTARLKSYPFKTRLLPQAVRLHWQYITITSGKYFTTCARFFTNRNLPYLLQLDRTSNVVTFDYFRDYRQMIYVQYSSPKCQF